MSQIFPRIRILQGIHGAAQATGPTVVIDVLRAFSTACYAFSQGARGIIPVADVTEALKLGRKHPDWIVMGERRGVKVPGFDLGNSPDEIRRFGSFDGRMVVQATSNGTRGIAAAANAEVVVTGSFVNAKAVADYLKTLKPLQVDLVCMGTSAEPAVEDDLCAAYIAGILREEPPDLDEIFQTISNHPTTRRFRTDDTANFPAKDLDLCLSADVFNFVLRGEVRSRSRLMRLSRLPGES